jgi:hypothetical protein
MRRVAVMAAVLAAALATAGSASAGTSLGSVGTIEYLKVTQTDVVAQDGPGASCDEGDTVTGGGGSISGSAANGALNGTAPSGSPNGWRAEGSTTGISPRKVTTYAICGEATFGYTTANYNVDHAGDSDDVTQASQGCSATETVLGGVRGVDGNVRIFRNQPTSANTQWAISVQNFANVDATATHWWACTDDYDVTRRSDSPTVRRGEAGKATVICERNEAVINGGLAITASGDPQRDTWAVATRPWDSSDKKKTPEDGWQAKAYNDSDGKVRLNVYAMCAAK